MAKTLLAAASRFTRLQHAVKALFSVLKMHMYRLAKLIATFSRACVLDCLEYLVFGPAIKAAAAVVQPYSLGDASLAGVGVLS